MGSNIVIIVFKRVFKWILLSIIIQLVILTYFNFVYIPGIGGAIETTKMVDDSANNNSASTQGFVLKTTKAKIPGNALQTKLSYDCSYAGYITDGKLNIVDVNTGAILKTFEQQGKKVSYFKWLYDRNLVLYAYASTDYSGRIQMLSYDMGTGLEHSYPEEYMPSSSEIVDIELSPLTNVCYTKVKTSDTRSRIYKYNIMSNFSIIMRTDLGIRIDETKYSDSLIYQDYSNDIQVMDGMNNTTTALGFNMNVALLDIDSEDNIYAGELNSVGKVTKIHFGKADKKPVSSWKTANLSTSVLPQNINITPSEKIYEVNVNDGSIYSVSDRKQIDFKGKYIEALDNGIAINNNGNLELLVSK